MLRPEQLKDQLTAGDAEAVKQVEAQIEMALRARFRPEAPFERVWIGLTPWPNARVLDTTVRTLKAAGWHAEAHHDQRDGSSLVVWAQGEQQ